MKLTMLACLTITLGGLPAVAGAAPILPGQTDTFEDLTTNGWFAGGGPLGSVPPTAPFVVSTGGPTGVDDAYLRITSVGGNGPGSRLVAMNASQWAGDYSGIGTIELDLLNLGNTDLTIRLLFEDPIPGPPTNIAVTTAAAVLAAGSGWTHVAFALSAADLTALMGSAAPLIANTTLLRIIHSSGPGAPEPIAGLLGVDNITATATPLQPVPEPATMLLVASGLVAGAVRRRRSRQ